jgi:hypothetical protein
MNYMECGVYEYHGKQNFFTFSVRRIIMSISGISLTNFFYQMYGTQANNSKDSQSQGILNTTASGSQNGKDQIATDLSALWEALQAGNVSSAQCYLSQLQEDLKAIGPSASDNVQNTPAAASDTASDSNPLAKELSSLEEALNSGDLTSAQNIFAQIMQHMQPPPPPPPPDDNASDVSQSAPNTSSTNAVSDSNPLANDLSALEDALDSGDLTSAQNIFAQIMQHMQPPPPDGNISDSSQNTIAATSSVSKSDLEQLLKMWTSIMTSTTSSISTST